MRLSFRGVAKAFRSLRGPVHAVREANLSVGDGELFVLLGPSGCGKSTVLNLAAGLERPTEGEIRFDDEIVASGRGKAFVPPAKRNVAMVFQSYALYPHLNVFGNIAFPLRVAGERRENVRLAVVRTASLLGIEPLLGAKPSELSGGQRQRVAIARAIVRKPRLFLLDEPLSNLDASLRAATRAELRRLQRTLGVTTLYVTHDQTEAMTLGDRVALLRDGRILQTGTPADLYERPQTPFAAAFVGPYPMNLLEAGVVGEPEGLFVALGGGKLLLPPESSEKIRSFRADRVLFGIRPEHVRISMAAGPSCLRGRVAVAEPLGRETLVHVELPGCVLTAVSEAAGIREGEAVHVSIPMERCHVFPCGGAPQESG